MGGYLIYTCGYPFSGKSTLAKEIAQETGFTLIAVDDRYKGNTNSSWIRAYASSYAAMFRCFEKDGSVIFDSVAHTRSSRDRLAQFARKYDVALIGIWLDIDSDEADRRRLSNVQRPIRPDVPKDDFRKIVDTFELPSPDERMLIYSRGVQVAPWVKQTLLPLLRNKGIPQ